jgi:hypothetical protein
MGKLNGSDYNIPYQNEENEIEYNDPYAFASN